MFPKVEAADGHLMVLDDEPANVDLLERMLRKVGYRHISCFTDVEAAMTSIREQAPDVLLLDLRMPVHGFTVMADLRAEGIHLPVICLTADSDPAMRRQALDLGASDFLTKPFDIHEVLLRIRNILRVKLLQDQLSRSNVDLERKVVERTADLEEARNEVLVRLSRAAEFRDDETHEHTLRVGLHAKAVAHALGAPPDWAEMLGQVAPLHDLGKIGVPDAVLLKPGRLSPEEFAVVKRHTEIGSTILGGGRSEMLQLAEEVARTHHEKWDGTGYLGLSGTAIPFSGRVVAVADVFDALTHIRPYKQAWTVDEACQEIKDLRATHFDPDVVDAFFSLIEAGDV